MGGKDAASGKGVGWGRCSRCRDSWGGNLTLSSVPSPPLIHDFPPTPQKNPGMHQTPSPGYRKSRRRLLGPIRGPLLHAGQPRVPNAAAPWGPQAPLSPWAPPTRPSRCQARPPPGAQVLLAGRPRRNPPTPHPTPRLVPAREGPWGGGTAREAPTGATVGRGLPRKALVQWPPRGGRFN